MRSRNPSAAAPAAVDPGFTARDCAPGAAADADLLAALVADGPDRLEPERARRWAAAALARFGGIGPVLQADARDLAGVAGFRSGDGVRLRAAHELLLRALRERLERGPVLSSPRTVAHYLQHILACRPHEVFAALFLDAQHRLLAFEELFRGTLTQTAVYPREVVKRALAHNAAGLILAHNHPSGTTEPSAADEALTRSLAEALALVDIRVVDHIIVAQGASLSFAEHGLI